MERELENCLNHFLVKIGLIDMEADVYCVAKSCDLFDAVYNVDVTRRYGALVALGHSGGVKVRSVKELESYFVGWEDRKDILMLLGIGEKEMFWDAHIFHIEQKGEYYEIYYAKLKKNTVVEKLIDGLKKFGLCGDGYFKLPVDGLREIIALLGV
jgi:hypothetical protein